VSFWIVFFLVFFVSLGCFVPVLVWSLRQLFIFSCDIRSSWMLPCFVGPAYTVRSGGGPIPPPRAAWGICLLRVWAFFEGRWALVEV
jgi:hypothetical protein